MELTVFLQNAEELNRFSFRTKRNGRSCEGLAATSVITVLFSDSPRALTHDKTRFNLNITFRLTAFTGVFFPLNGINQHLCRQFPISFIRLSTVVSLGYVCSERMVLSCPTTDISSGMRRPLSRMALMAPKATVSLNANTAVGGSSSSSRRIIAS